MVERWLPVVIQLVTGAFFAGILWARVYGLNATVATNDERNREDHKDMYGRLDEHGERIAGLERGCSINHKKASAHAN